MEFFCDMERTLLYCVFVFVVQIYMVVYVVFIEVPMYHMPVICGAQDFLSSLFF